MTDADNIIPFGEYHCEHDAARWIATITYRSECGPVVLDHYIEELDQLDGLIEQGPDWNALIEVKVVLNPLRATHPGITMEAAARR
jgi:hypothetical protein